MSSVAKSVGRTIGVLGLARSGLAVTRHLLGEGAVVHAFDDRPEALDAALDLGALAGNAASVPGLDLLVVSPGIPLHLPAPHPVVAAARAAGVPLTGDVDLFAERIGGPVVGVTGTNGKSTTTALIHHLLAAADRDAVCGGNIGVPVFDLPLDGQERVYVLELSSYQLDLSDRLHCRVAVWLNLTPDHLDRHGDLAAYGAAKERIFARQTGDDTAVIAVDDEPSRALAQRLRGAGRRVIAVSANDMVEGGVAVIDQCVIDGLDGTPREIASLAGIESLRGRHNAQNAAAAYAAVRALGLAPAEAAKGFASFAGLPHRMELVGRIGRVTFINDSKATNPDAASRSLGSYDDIYWIGGGRPKPGGFAGLVPHLARVRAGYFIGDAASAMKGDLGAQIPVRLTGTLDRAVSEAAIAAEQSPYAQPVVLLAPACASFDQFTDYEARGACFRKLVGRLAARHGTGVAA